jgi:hypothetical protein
MGLVASDSRHDPTMGARRVIAVHCIRRYRHENCESDCFHPIAMHYSRADFSRSADQRAPLGPEWSHTSAQVTVWACSL